MTAAKTTAERQRAFRARLRADGLTEVRGVFARPKHHARIKAYAARLEVSQACDKAPTQKSKVG